MKRLQLKYDILVILYFIFLCTVGGYATVFLKWKGFSNTEVGIVIGISNLLLTITSPKISGLTKKYRKLTLLRLLPVLFLTVILCWLLVTFLKLPNTAVMLLFIFISNLTTSVIPLLSMLCMDYVHAGHYVDFGSARGMGSLSYAVISFSNGFLIDLLNPSVLAMVVLLSGTGMIITCLLLPKTDLPSSPSGKLTKKRSGISMVGFIRKYPHYTLLLVGNMFQFLSSSALGTYLINIVKNLGGTTSVFGIVTFMMAASELPFMAISYSLKKKHKVEHLFLFSSAMYLARNYLICLAPNIPVLSIGLLCQGASFGLFFATMTYHCSDVIEPDDQTMGQTLITVMTNGLGAAIGVFIGGRLQDVFGLYSMYAFAMAGTMIGFLIVVLSVRRMSAHRIASRS